MTQLECLGILDRRGGVVLRVGIKAAEGTDFDQMLNVYDTVNNDLWGQVSLVEVQSSSSLYEPIDRANPEFWEHLEDRMKYDTSPPPGIRLERQFPDSIVTLLDQLLENWKV